VLVAPGVVDVTLVAVVVAVEDRLAGDLDRLVGVVRVGVARQMVIVSLSWADAELIMPGAARRATPRLMAAEATTVRRVRFWDERVSFG